MQNAGRPSEGWAKGQPEEAVFFGCGKLNREQQRWAVENFSKKVKKSRHKPIDKCKQVRYNGSKLKERKLQWKNNTTKS